MPDPAVIIEEIALEVVPLTRRVVAGGVVIDLSSPDGVVAVFTEVNGNGRQVGMVGFPPVLVVVDTGRGGEETAQDGGPAGTADRSRAVGIREDGAPGRETIEVGSVHPAGVTAQESDPVVEIVEGEKENIFPGVRSGTGDLEITREEDGEDGQKA